MPFNNLTAAEDERLALVMEECGEVIQAIGKIMRHSYQSQPPGGGLPNREYLERDLEREIGDLLGVLDLMVEAGDLSDIAIARWRAQKPKRMAQYLHHQAKVTATRSHEQQNAAPQASPSMAPEDSESGSAAGPAVAALAPSETKDIRKCEHGKFLYERCLPCEASASGAVARPLCDECGGFHFQGTEPHAPPPTTLPRTCPCGAPANYCADCAAGDVRTALSATRAPDSVMEPCVQAFNAYNDGRIDSDECVHLMANALRIVIRRADGTGEANG